MRKLRGRAGKSGSAFVRFFSGSFFFASAALAVFFEPPDGMIKTRCLEPTREVGLGE